VVPDGEGAAAALSQSGHALEFLKDQYRHCKAILLLGASASLLDKAGIPAALVTGEPDSGLIIGTGDTASAVADFVTALTDHRAFERETDPPRV
jgi:catalase